MMELLDCGLVDDVLIDHGTPRDDVQAFIKRVHQKVRVDGVSYIATFVVKRPKDTGDRVYILIASDRDMALATIGDASLDGEILQLTDLTVH